MKNKKEKRITRHLKIRQKVYGTETKPRLSVFRSNKYIYAQIINDHEHITLFSVSDKESKAVGKLAKAKEIGQSLAEKAGKKSIKNVVFDRSGYKYHGRIKSLAEGAREGGLVF